MKILFTIVKYLIIVSACLVLYFLLYFGSEFAFPQKINNVPAIHISKKADGASDTSNDSEWYEVSPRSNTHWRFKYEIQGSYFMNSMTLERNNIDNYGEINVNESSQLDSDTVGFILGYSMGGFDIFTIKDDILKKTHFDLQDNVVFAKWNGQDFLIISIGNDLQLYAYWYRYEDESWKYELTLMINEPPGDFGEGYTVRDYGVYVNFDNNVLFVPYMSKEYSVPYINSELISVLGDKNYFVAEVLRDQKILLEIYYRGKKEIILHEDTLPYITFHNFETRKLKRKNNTRDNATQFDITPYLELYRVSSTHAKFEIKQFSQVYSVEVPVE